ncbi:MAG TPA: NUDIX domain-containing protein [Candidatus Saccharimonadales bacterium]|nr:NUDIX domain-containing protein [Candidatus Saccharimonadales bacterium]
MIAVAEAHDLVRHTGLHTTYLEPELLEDALIPYEAAFANYSDGAVPLLDRIDRAHNPDSASPWEQPSKIPGFQSAEIHLGVGYIYRFTFEQDGTSYECESFSPLESADSEYIDTWFARRTAGLLDGVGAERLAQLVAVDRERNLIIKSTVPGKDVANLPNGEIRHISTEQIQDLSRTVQTMRERGIGVPNAHQIRYDAQLGFFINDYTRKELRSLDIAANVDENVVTFLHYALADWNKFDAYRSDFSNHLNGAPYLPARPETTGLRKRARDKILGIAAAVQMTEGPFANYNENATDLPEPQPAPRLLEVVNLRDHIAPAGAARFVRSSVHVVERANGSTGYQVVNEMADGVSVAALEKVLGHAYLLLVDQVRYPHQRPGHENLSLEQAARLGQIGIWSRELISGGVEATDQSIADAAMREAAEEAGVFGLRPEDVEQILPTLLSSISVNRQPFNLFAAEIGNGMWDPRSVHPDVEEGDLRVNAYRLDTAVMDMIRNGTVRELSAVTAIMGLHNTRWRRYMP